MGRGRSRRQTGVSGDIEALSMWAGQGIGLVDRVQPAAEIVEELANETEATIASLTEVKR